MFVIKTLHVKCIYAYICLWKCLVHCVMLQNTPNVVTTVRLHRLVPYVDSSKCFDPRTSHSPGSQSLALCWVTLNGGLCPWTLLPLYWSFCMYWLKIEIGQQVPSLGLLGAVGDPGFICLLWLASQCENTNPRALCLPTGDTSLFPRSTTEAAFLSLSATGWKLILTTAPTLSSSWSQPERGD